MKKQSKNSKKRLTASASLKKAIRYRIEMLQKSIDCFESNIEYALADNATERKDELESLLEMIK